MFNKFIEFFINCYQAVKDFINTYLIVYLEKFAMIFFTMDSRYLICILLIGLIFFDFWKTNFVFKSINFVIVWSFVNYLYFFRNVDFLQVYRDDEVIFKKIKSVYFGSPLICREQDIHDLFYILQEQHKKINTNKTNLFVVANRYKEFRFTGFISGFDDMRGGVTTFSFFFGEVISRQKKYDVLAQKLLDLIHDRFNGAKDNL